MVNILIFWKSKDLCNERTTSVSAFNCFITPKLNYYGSKTRVKFKGSCSKQDKTIYTHGKTVNIYIVYEITKMFDTSSYPTMKNCLFGAVTLTKNNHIDKY